MNPSAIMKLLKYSHHEYVEVTLKVLLKTNFFTVFSTLHERRDFPCRQFFQSVLDKSNCLNYLLPELRSDDFKDRLRHPPVFKLPRVRTTRFKSSFINYAVDHYVWPRLILKCLIIVSCRCSNERVKIFILYYLHLWVFCNFTFPYVFCNPALGLQHY